MKSIVLAFLAALGICAANAQSVGIGTNTPNPKAALEIRSTTKGLLIPSMTTVQRQAIIAPPNGLLVYDTDFKEFLHYSGMSWITILNSLVWTSRQGRLIVYNASDSIGIGTASPTQRLDVHGSIRSRNDILADGNLMATGIVSGGTLQTPGNILASGLGFINGNLTTNSNLTVGGTSKLTGNITTDGDIIIKNSGAILQLRNESNVNTGFLQLSGSNVRIGTNSGNNGQLIIRMNGNDRIRFDQGGNMDIEGQIYNSTISAGAPLLPKCYGYVNSDGTINSGTGNFSVTKELTGSYRITCAGINANSIFLSSVPYQTSTSSVFYDSPNKLAIRTWDTNTGLRVDRQFYFLVY